MPRNVCSICFGREAHALDNEHVIPLASDGRDLEVRPAALAALIGDDVGQVSGAKAHHEQCFLASAR
jgi:hypothetical protein